MNRRGRRVILVACIAMLVMLALLGALCFVSKEFVMWYLGVAGVCVAGMLIFAYLDKRKG